MRRNAKYWREKLDMLPHPEGGHFKETYRSEEVAKKEHLPEHFPGDRNFSTGIFYLLEKDECSKFHRIKSDEMWHFYDGTSLTIYEINEAGDLIEHKLGLDADNGQKPQVLIKKNVWFGAKLDDPDSYCLAGCTVSPGFHFEDFEMGKRDDLTAQFPNHEKIIRRLSK